MPPRERHPPLVVGKAGAEELLAHGRVVELGQVPGASNDTRLVIVEQAGESLRAICKPSAGARPLRDFDASTLSLREVAAYRLSEQLGLDVVPPTVWRADLPLPGSVQAYVETDGTAAVEVFAAPEVPAGWVPVLSGVDADDAEVVVAHAQLPALRTLALFDWLSNNADRKGSHIISGHYLADDQPARLFAIDNGLTFHRQTKLRTVLWGFAGEPFTAAETQVLAAAAVLDDAVLLPLLSPAEIAAVRVRAQALLRLGAFPHPPQDRYPIPWPPL